MFRECVVYSVVAALWRGIVVCVTHIRSRTCTRCQVNRRVRSNVSVDCVSSTPGGVRRFHFHQVNVEYLRDAVVCMCCACAHDFQVNVS